MSGIASACDGDWRAHKKGGGAALPGPRRLFRLVPACLA